MRETDIMNGSGLFSQHIRTVEEDKCLYVRVRASAGASACGWRGIFTLSYRTGRGLRALGQHKREKSLAPAPPASFEPQRNIYPTQPNSHRIQTSVEYTWVKLGSSKIIQDLDDFLFSYFCQHVKLVHCTSTNIGFTRSIICFSKWFNK